MFSTAKYI